MRTSTARPRYLQEQAGRELEPGERIQWIDMPVPRESSDCSRHLPNNAVEGGPFTRADPWARECGSGAVTAWHQAGPGAVPG